MTAAPVVAVPGKLFVAGEYAVLDGAPAVVAAAGRTATGCFVPGAAPTSALISAVMAEVRARLQAHPGRALPVGAAQVDTSSFMEAGTKLGLGSSAAAAVAAAGAAYEHAGLAIAEHRELLLATADAGHRAAQGGVGSGADIAAAVHGGFIRFERSAGEPARIAALAAPADLALVTFWTRAAARTVDFIAGVRRFAGADPDGHRRRMHELQGAAQTFAAAFAQSAPATVDAAAGYGAALDALGVDAALPIVTPAVRAAMALARSLGGAAKPSGAGGGDMGIAFFVGKAAADAFAARCRDGVLVLDIPLGVAGAHRRAPDDVRIFNKD